jgi:hypothetical protein
VCSESFWRLGVLAKAPEQLLKWQMELQDSF